MAFLAAFLFASMFVLIQSALRKRKQRTVAGAYGDNSGFAFGIGGDRSKQIAPKLEEIFRNLAIESMQNSPIGVFNGARIRT